MLSSELVRFTFLAIWHHFHGIIAATLDAKDAAQTDLHDELQVGSFKRKVDTIHNSGACKDVLGQLYSKWLRIHGHTRQTGPSTSW